MADVLPSDELIEEPSDFGALKPGTRLGRYELLVPIARGGMARVWAARLHGQRGFQKLVAIKTILPHLASETEFERMFLDEARIASGVHHPNVCEIYELGEETSTLYLAMEWVSGDSFSRLLRASGKTEAVDARVVARIIADACAGLHAAHELTDDIGRQLDVVHRDLSPHNILLTADGIAKVADFGVAKALGQLHEATSAGQLKGKIHYMSPEQVTGAPIDRRSDVFSLGCVLYEATTGLRPFRGDGDHQVMHQLLKGEFAPPSSVVHGYPQELERIVQRAMSPQPLLRFPTAERMRFALEEFLTRGSLVTTANVAQVLRQRIGEHLDRRKERIRVASSANDREGGWSEPPTVSRTPSGEGAHRSGVKQTAARPLYSTMQMGPTGTPMPPSMPGPGAETPPMPGIPAVPADFESATTIQPAPVMGMSGGGYDMPPPSTANPPRTVTMNAIAQPPTRAMPITPQYIQQPLQMPPVRGQEAGATSQRQNFAPPYSVPPAEPQASPAQYAIAAGVGVLLAVVIGTGGFLAWRAKHRAAPSPPALISAPSATASVTASAPASSPPPPAVVPPAAPLPVTEPVVDEIAADAAASDQPPAADAPPPADLPKPKPRPVPKAADPAVPDNPY